MESRRLKNKKQELESYQKRVVAYAKRQKRTLCTCWEIGS